jgi:D-aspartate ligase
MKDQSKPPAIVIGLDCITGLQSARILAGHDIPVIGVAKDPAHFCCRTNVCTKILHADTGGEELIHLLQELGPKLQQKAVLYPCTDMSVLQISRFRQQLEAWYYVALPAAEIVELLMNKVSFYQYAQQKGLPIPTTFFLQSRADAEEAARELSFPVMLKPGIRTPAWEKQSKDKVYKAYSEDEFLFLYEQCSKWTDMLIVQEWIEGSDASLFSCNCYFDASSNPLVTFIARKIRQWPPEIGISCLGEECRNDIVLEESIRLFRSVNYRGLGYVEMKQDSRTGKHYIIEPNIGRPTGRSAIAEAGGVDLLYAKYCDVVGLPLPASLHQRYSGVKWIYWRQDIRSALYYWRRGDLTLREWWRSWQGRKGYAVLSRSDPAPFYYDIRDKVIAPVIRNVIKKIKNKVHQMRIGSSNVAYKSSKSQR